MNVSKLKIAVVLLAVFMAQIGCGGGCNCNSKDSIREPNALKNTNSTIASDNKTSLGRATDLIPVGRAFEAGDVDLADKLLGDNIHLNEKSRYLGALIAGAQKDYDGAIALLNEVSFKDEGMEFKRKIKILDALAGMETYDAAIDEIEKTLREGQGLSNGQRRRLLTRQGDYCERLGRYEDAERVFRRLLKNGGPKEKEKNALSLAKSLKSQGKDQEAAQILTPLALSARSFQVMEKSFELLGEMNKAPDWSVSEKLDRVRTLMSLKSWDAAQRMLTPVLESSTGAIGKDAKWLQAQLLFKRRRHYEEAIGALDDVIQDGGPHVAEAQFLKARALSRVDRDDEAIVAFRHFAKNTRRPGRRDEALFLAGRLEFYLGKHSAARKNLEKLVGTGARVSRTNKASLDSDRVREAHFLAGLSAILEGMPAKAKDHLTAASKGSSSQEAIARNRYWYAVSRFMVNKGDGAKLLREICEEDPTSWYGLFAGIRLQDANAPLGRCYQTVDNNCKDGNCKIDVSAEAHDSSKNAFIGSEFLVPTVSLDSVSSTADLYSQMGLYKEAAAELRKAEKTKSVNISSKDWVIHYVLLDAPQYAIRRASIGLDWHARNENLWRAHSAYPRPYGELVSEVESLHGLPQGLVYAIARKESLFDPHAVSYVGAMGLMQMMPATYETNRKRAGLAPLSKGKLPTPEESVKAGAYELAHLLKMYDGSMPLAIMAYNAGTSAVTRWLERSGEFPMDVFVEKAGFAQTRNYVRRVYQILVRYRILAKRDLPFLPRQTPPQWHSN